MAEPVTSCMSPALAAILERVADPVAGQLDELADLALELVSALACATVKDAEGKDAGGYLLGVACDLQDLVDSLESAWVSPGLRTDGR